MDELLAAIYSRFTGANGATLGNLLGARNNMFFSRAPLDAVTPYITYDVVSNGDADSKTSQQYLPTISFTIWDDRTGPERAWSCVEPLQDLYSDILFNLTDWKTVRAQIVQPGIAVWDDNSEFYGITVDFLYQIGK